MINHQGSCFFAVKISDGAAEQVTSDFAPRMASDIVEVVLLSKDFDSDITAVNDFDRVVKHVSTLTPELTVREHFNPLYLPTKMEAMDDILTPEVRTDTMRFTGFNGNPFTIKLFEAKADGETVVSALAQFHPFELPNYSEIVTANEHYLPN